MSAAIRGRRDIEREIESEFISSDGKSAFAGRHRNGTDSQPIDDRVGKNGGRTGVRKHIHDQDEMPRTLRTGECKDVRDVGDWIGDGVRSGDVVRHVCLPYALLSRRIVSATWKQSAPTGIPQ